MASYSLTSITASTVQFTVSGLTNGDKVRLYLRRADSDTAMYDEELTVGKATISKTYYGLSAGTAYAANVKVNDDWLGRQDFTTLGTIEPPVNPPDEPERPSDWTWYSTIASGKEINISAVEWNNFCSRINEFREYAGLSSYNFTTVYPDDEISANIVNQARTAISAIIGTDTLPSAVKSKDPITASFFLSLSDALNII